MLRKILKAYVLRTGGNRLLRKLANLSRSEYLEYLRRHGGFQQIGEHCQINRDTVITDPSYVSIGNNVIISTCALIGHDASCAVMERATGLRMDCVGKIDVRDNVFIGYGAIVLPGVTIGPNAIVAAGAIVSRDVPPDAIVAGNPAKVIGSFAELARRRSAELDTIPWGHLIRQRHGAFDPVMEPGLRKLRVAHFYEEAEPRSPGKFL